MPYRSTQQFNDALRSKPDVVLIMLGTNDAKTDNWDATAYSRDAKALIEEFASLPSKPIVHVFQPPPLYHDGFANMHQNIIQEVIPKLLCVAVERVGSDRVHCESGMFERLGGAQLACRRCMFATNHINDGCHPTDYGYEQLADAALAVLKADGLVSIEAAAGSSARLLLL